MGGSRPPLRPGHVMELAGHPQRLPITDIPDATDDVDGPLQRLHGLARGQPPAAHRLDRVPESAGAERQIETAAGQLVKAHRCPGQHRGRTHRHVQDVAATRIRSVREATQVSSVQVSKNLGW